MKASGAQEPSAIIRIGTRGSPLALAQSIWVAERLRAFGQGALLTPIQTTGDRLPEATLATLGGTGAFTKEIQRALLDETVDVGVHSLKDLPTIPVPGLVLAFLMLFTPEPARGATEDEPVTHEKIAFAEGLRRLLPNRVFWAATAGLTAVTFSMGANPRWTPRAR